MKRRLLLRTQGQRGQVLPIFAVCALVMIGAVALAVDYGFLTDQRRNLQSYADHAAVAGAEALTIDGSHDAAARQAAMEYLRDNLGGSFSTASGSPCGAYTANITSCQLPSPFSNYKVSIHVPGDYVQPHTCATCPQTLSVEVTDLVSNDAARVFGISTSNVKVHSEARTQWVGEHLAGALTTDGCLNNSALIGTPLVVDGDIYVNQCTVASSGLLSGVCSLGTPGQAGNITYGPMAFEPGSLVQGLPIGTSCSVNALGVVTSAGGQTQLPTSNFPSGLPGPPQGADVCGGEPGGCGSTHACKNGTVSPTGSSLLDCYDPGVYSNASMLVHNNLNPGVYYVDVSSGSCYNNSAVTNCGGVFFTGNTMNANINGVIHQCWGGGNIPAANTWTTPCPDGLTADPTWPVDPQCAGSTAVDAKGTPGILGLGASYYSFTAAPGGVGSLGANQPYSVRVSALSGIGETDAPTEVNTTSSPTGGITVTVTASPTETGGYNVYVGPPGQEQFVVRIAHGSTTATITSLPGAGAQHYPRFNNSFCTSGAGFHNIPHSVDQVPGSLAAPNQNFGVTFVLTGKAGFCTGNSTGPVNNPCVPTSTPTYVLLQPYCASGFSPTPDSQTCADAGSSLATLEDGAYTVYGSSLGAVRASGGQLLGGPTLLGNPSQLNLTGTVYLPRGQLIEDSFSKLTVYGQVVVHDVSTGISLNLLNPLVYYSPSVGATLPPGVALVQ